jgi:NAD(P)-dependent dehydrogenase (short-subunit alcohol dehydrogenase family)
MVAWLKGKVALVVGAGSTGPGWGNGKTTAVVFARRLLSLALRRLGWCLPAARLLPMSTSGTKRTLGNSLSGAN